MTGVQTCALTISQWAPIGYTNDLKAHTIVKDEGKAPFVTKLFELYVTGRYSLNDLKDKVGALGLIGQRGKPLSISRIQRILTNHFYYGNFVYKGEMHEGTHEPIITKKLFDQCQAVMRRRGKPMPSVRHFALKGLMRCGECGRTITAELQKDHVYYRCTKRLTICSQRYVREEALATQIQAILQKVSLCDDWTTKILKERSEERRVGKEC